MQTSDDKNIKRKNIKETFISTLQLFAFCLVLAIPVVMSYSTARKKQVQNIMTVEIIDSTKNINNY